MGRVGRLEAGELGPRIGNLIHLFPDPAGNLLNSLRSADKRQLSIDEEAIGFDAWRVPEGGDRRVFTRRRGKEVDGAGPTKPRYKISKLSFPGKCIARAPTLNDIRRGLTAEGKLDVIDSRLIHGPGQNPWIDWHLRSRHLATLCEGIDEYNRSGRQVLSHPRHCLGACEFAGGPNRTKGALDHDQGGQASVIAVSAAGVARGNESLAAQVSLGREAHHEIANSVDHALYLAFVEILGAAVSALRPLCVPGSHALSLNLGDYVGLTKVYPQSLHRSRPPLPIRVANLVLLSYLPKLLL